MNIILYSFCGIIITDAKNNSFVKGYIMGSIIIVLLVGIGIGVFMKPTEGAKNVISKLQFIGVVLLLFSMGAGLGLNDDLLANLKNIGLIGVSFALLTTVCSVAVVFIVTQLYERRAQWQYR